MDKKGLIRLVETLKGLPQQSRDYAIKSIDNDDIQSHRECILDLARQLNVAHHKLNAHAGLVDDFRDIVAIAEAILDADRSGLTVLDCIARLRLIRKCALAQAGEVKP